MAVAAFPFPTLLREGDQLSADEFLRRWDAMPALKRAELIDGIVFMASPVSYPHGKHQLCFGNWLWCFAEATPGTDAAAESTWVMAPRNVPQPDLTLRILPERGGQSGMYGPYGAGAPELIVEISGSSTSRDLGVKLELYRRTGVKEYISVLLEFERIIWRQLIDGSYEEITPDADGLLRSRTFPGLWLDPAAALDPAQSLRTALEQGLRSPEHAAFVHYLSK